MSVVACVWLNSFYSSTNQLSYGLLVKRFEYLVGLWWIPVVWLVDR